MGSAFLIPRCFFYHFIFSFASFLPFGMSVRPYVCHCISYKCLYISIDWMRRNIYCHTKAFSVSDNFYEETHKNELINSLIYSFHKNIYSILPRYHQHHSHHCYYPSEYLQTSKHIHTQTHTSTSNSTSTSTTTKT